MKNMVLTKVIALSLMLLLANSLTSVAIGQSDSEKQQAAREHSDRGDIFSSQGNYREQFQNTTWQYL